MQGGQLFSEYFIIEGIKTTEDYQSLDDNELNALFSEFKVLFEDFANRKEPDEADTEDDLIRPVLERLGFHYTRQKAIQKKGKSDFPEFLLFDSKENKKAFGQTSDWSLGCAVPSG